MIKILGMSASGKSAKVEVSIKNFNDSIHTYPAETVRMDNINSFIRQEVALRDRVKNNSEKFEVLQGA